jgi:nucleoid-associated protein YgaU
VSATAGEVLAGWGFSLSAQPAADVLLEESHLSEERTMANLDALKQKYQPVIELAKQRGVSLKNVHIENDKLLIRGAAPNDHVKNEVWSRIKTIDPVYADLTADITIDASLPVPEKIHVVAAGDTLSKIARQFYGDAGKYTKIFEANKDQLSDPDKIKIGQKLRIPD